jgi:hypothetical protein
LGAFKECLNSPNFQDHGINIPIIVKDVIGFEYETLHELKLIKNITLDNFHELTTYCILVYDGVVVGFLLHNFVPLNEATNYAITMVHLFEHGGHMMKACSLEMAMVMFSHRFYKIFNTNGK